MRVDLLRTRTGGKFLKLASYRPQRGLLGQVAFWASAIALSEEAHCEFGRFCAECVVKRSSPENHPGASRLASHAHHDVRSRRLRWLAAASRAASQHFAVGSPPTCFVGRSRDEPVRCPGPEAFNAWIADACYLVAHNGRPAAPQDSRFSLTIGRTGMS